MGCVEAQRNQGPVGELAVNFEILMGILIVISGLGFLQFDLWSYLYSGASVFLFMVGFYGAYNRHDTCLYTYQLVTFVLLIIRIVVFVLVVISFIAILAIYNSDTPCDAYQQCDTVTETVIVLWIFLVGAYGLGFFVTILSLVWVIRLRKLMNGGYQNISYTSAKVPYRQQSGNEIVFYNNNPNQNQAPYGAATVETYQHLLPSPPSQSPAPLLYSQPPSQSLYPSPPSASNNQNYGTSSNV